MERCTPCTSPGAGQMMRHDAQTRRKGRVGASLCKLRTHGFTSPLAFIILIAPHTVLSHTLFTLCDCRSRWRWTRTLGRRTSGRRRTACTSVWPSSRCASSGSRCELARMATGEFFGDEGSGFTRQAAGSPMQCWPGTAGRAVYAAADPGLAKQGMLSMLLLTCQRRACECSCCPGGAGPAHSARRVCC